ncbi:MAG: hypothetical protein A3F31_01755 [Candidatus Levybacteria bacterium RIFCSPHIGHO2_12_FULL_38_12]|nr:MAG: hypothetical protein A2770_03215 [Candidatus Levybacteria bacterium RIFCSPHIGHO2_01_FULL_38_12]OGH22202.1 MAG: hypothetical protein A3F31_01755 [Candidatus Levybacteria bacterium RIFCSPHIGHO2_12_FULL_38_12]OGH34366.1 MAG: hypothetical protein A3A47_02115 [Candidatus Levybacteria bacterium RIFCSPLOWO2_01_FULL_37_20]OGH44248.1 MAG: hypothetical protein A3J14_01700 [Candidatus Levybacteria bacterium RIFCSPLOWO2_02_FULL_37_18]OGH51694.1 MAG: hypothetical protein A3G13_00585 [Candidatus Levy
MLNFENFLPLALSITQTKFKIQNSKFAIILLPMKQHILRLFFLISLCLFFFFAQTSFSEDQIDTLGKQIDELTRALNMSINATRPLESELSRLQNQITGIKGRVSAIEQDIFVKRRNIEEGYTSLDKQTAILERAIRDFYIKSYYSSPFLIFISASSASEITRLLTYQKKATEQDKAIITNIALTIADLETKKKNLELEQTRLTAFKKNLDEQSDKLDKVVTGAKAYQANLSSQIAQLSAQQQQLISQRQSGLNIPRSAGTGAPACIDDRTIDPGFSPRIAFFTYGVPNRVGMNQYGAFGRARTGQDYSTILHAYYNFDEVKDVDANIQIRVDGHGTYSLEDYVKRIYEVPNSWGDNGGMEALKAQAIAARSYALAYTNNGSGSICDSQNCQVFQDGEKGGNWNSAVEATRGKAMTQGDQVIKAWFSSTHGGYIFSSSEIGWNSTSWTKHAIDTPSGGAGGFGELQNNAYDKDSPWFYCDWGARGQYNKTAWLKSEEIADIANVILFARADSSTKDHFYQTDRPHPYGGEVWNADRVQSELKNRGITPFTSASDVSISDVDFSGGRTNRVTISGNGKTESFSGSEFKDWFNLRAPANIQIVGPLYNVEKR